MTDIQLAYAALVLALGGAIALAAHARILTKKLAERDQEVTRLRERLLREYESRAPEGFTTSLGSEDGVIYTSAPCIRRIPWDTLDHKPTIHGETW